MATSDNVFIGSDGKQMKDVSAYVPYIDHILLMNYDVWGASSNPGPNAPLANGCGKSYQPGANAAAAIASWTAAGMPASHLVLGLPAYGYVSSSSATKLVPRGFEEAEPKMLTHREMFEIGSKEGRARRRAAAKAKRQLQNDNPSATSQAAAASPSVINADNIVTKIDPETGATIVFCPNNHSGYGCSTPVTEPSGPAPPSASVIVKASGSGDLSAFKGQQINFNKLITLGALTKDSSGNYVGRNGYTRGWDTCSTTPFLYNQVRNTVVTYDDPTSIRAKAAFAKSKGIGGIAFWSIEGG